MEAPNQLIVGQESTFPLEIELHIEKFKDRHLQEKEQIQTMYDS